MPVKYGKFELPTKIQVDEEGKSSTFVRFIAEPFERGFAHTVGNSIRRVMLTSLESPAIISVAIEGVPHEYMAIDGVIEDMTHIILNLKRALLRKLPTEESGNTLHREPAKLSKVLDVTAAMIEENGGQYKVTFGDIMPESEFEIVNPETELFTVTQPLSKRIDLRVAVGRGYVPSERIELQNKAADEIVMDACFSPVTLVNYFVENTRVGQDTDYDRLVLEVTSDGRITPEEALTFATQILTVHLNVFQELQFTPISFDEVEEEENTDKDALLAKLALKINEIELSVRSTNCLAQANIDTIAELVVMPESEMLRFRNFGKKSLNEIKAKLEEMGLHLGMDLSRYGISRDNVKDIVEEYLKEKMGQEPQQ